MIENPQLE